MNITIVGSGYVGLVSGACFAELGHTVMCIDKDRAKVEKLLAGEVPFYEPGLDELVRSNHMEGRLRFSTDMKAGVEHGLVIFIAVDTPTKNVTGEADLSFVEQVAMQVGGHIGEYRLIVEKSTVPVQTGEWLEQTIRSHAAPGVEFDVASNPEFLREGTAVDDFLRPDRVVLGVTSERAASLLVSIYEPLNAPLLLTDIKSAELIKHSANAYLAMKISFINSIANICDRVGADVTKVARGIGLDKRIGMEFLQAGIGYGGSCFPKDVAAFINISERLGYDFGILKAVQQVNGAQHTSVVRKLLEHFQNLEGKTIAVQGLSFKPHTDDLRNAPSLVIIRELCALGARIRAYDPVSLQRACELLPGKDIVCCRDFYDAAEGSDAVVLVTEWPEFKYLDFGRVKKSMKSPVLIDGRNMYDPSRMRQLGFVYSGIGRK